MPEKTAESFIEEDGLWWFITGDIAEITDKGVIRIIDRKKDLVKLINGEYISLGNIETKLKAHPGIENIFAYAKPGKTGCICIAVPNENYLRKLAKKFDLPNDISFEDLCINPSIVSALFQELLDFGRDHEFGLRELPLGLYLSPEPWTPESGLVTAAMKLRRQALVAHFETQINNLYRNIDKNNPIIKK